MQSEAEMARARRRIACDTCKRTVFNVIKIDRDGRTNTERIEIEEDTIFVSCRVARIDDTLQQTTAKLVYEGFWGRLFIPVEYASEV